MKLSYNPPTARPSNQFLNNSLITLTLSHVKANNFCREEDRRNSNQFQKYRG
uniref:Uncharacterized protein n=1 Tax=Manihot esculenta TaxID=3983 RepID=A0A2C9U7E8_MANES